VLGSLWIDRRPLGLGVGRTLLGRHRRTRGRADRRRDQQTQEDSPVHCCFPSLALLAACSSIDLMALVSSGLESRSAKSLSVQCFNARKASKLPASFLASSSRSWRLALKSASESLRTLSRNAPAFSPTPSVSDPKPWTMIETCSTTSDRRSL